MLLLIIDINDNVPRFSEPEVLYRIEESTPPGTQFILPEAYDPDSSEYSLSSRSYSLHSRSDNLTFELKMITQRTFLPASAQINRSSNSYKEKPYLVIKRELDRETIASYSLEMRAVDGGGLSGTTQIRITVRGRFLFRFYFHFFKWNFKSAKRILL